MFNLPTPKLDEPCTDSLQRHLHTFYFDMYVARWSAPAVSSVLAATPGVMMWDDHDIFDGFGSYSSEFQQCSIIRGLFSAASNAFMKFQLCIEEPHELVCGGPKLPDFSHAIRLGKAVFIALDF